MLAKCFFQDLLIGTEPPVSPSCEIVSCRTHSLHFGAAATQKLFSEIAPKFSDRAGGCTRIIRAGNRVGDNGKVAILEIIGYQYKEKEKKEKSKKEEPAEASS